MPAPRQSAYDLTQWLPMPPGQAEAVDTMGTIAAPLLAGFAFAGIGLVLQIQDKLRWPDLVLGLLVCTLLLFITSVQATFHAKRRLVPPSEWLAWQSIAPNQQRRDELERQYRVGLGAYKRWASIARRTYGVAIVGLFSATSVLLVPSASVGVGRLIAIVLAGIGALAEIAWTISVEFNAMHKRQDIRYMPSTAAIARPKLEPPT